MSIRRFVVMAAMAAAVISTAPVLARTPDRAVDQGPPDAQKGFGTASAVTLQVTVTISRWEGEKKVASAPYVLLVVPSYGTRAEQGADGDSVSLQMGSETPVPVTETKDGKLTTSVNYRTLGTNINVAARPVNEGMFNLFIMVQDSQLSPAPAGTAAQGATPKYQTFRFSNRLTMRDRQTTQFAVASDTTTGQVIKLDVAMNVVK